MTYVNGTCALQMPSSYVLMTKDEMTYVDGGYNFLCDEKPGGTFSVAMLFKNIWGLCQGYAVAAGIASVFYIRGTSVLDWARIGCNLAKSVVQSAIVSTCAKIGVELSSVNALVGIVVGVSGLMAMSILGSGRYFY